MSQEYITTEGLRINIPALADFPEPFRSFIATIRSELADYAGRTISVLRWRKSHLGPHNPISRAGFHWSVDDAFWHPVPINTGVRSLIRGVLRASAHERLNVTELVAAGAAEPLHHDLFREAWAQRDTHPRSSLVIGMGSGRDRNEELHLDFSSGGRLAGD